MARKGRLEIRVVYGDRQDASDTSSEAGNAVDAKKRKREGSVFSSASPPDAKEAADLQLKLNVAEEQYKNTLADLEAERAKVGRLELQTRKLRGDICTCKDLSAVYEMHLCDIVNELSCAKGSVKEFVQLSSVYSKYLHLARKKAQADCGGRSPLPSESGNKNATLRVVFSKHSSNGQAPLQESAANRRHQEQARMARGTAACSSSYMGGMYSTPSSLLASSKKHSI
jgi:hypothetical protein